MTDKYYITYKNATIAKVKLKDTTTYEPWIAGKQYCGFLTSADAKRFVDEIQP